MGIYVRVLSNHKLFTNINIQSVYTDALLKNLITTIAVFSCLFLSNSSVWAATSKLCPGESGYYFTNNRKTNPVRGGFVSEGAYVSESAFIAPSAAVCGSASVEYGVRVMGKAVVKDEAMISGNVRVMGNATVGGTAMISGDNKKPTIIKGWANITEGEITSGRHGSSVVPKAVKDQQAVKSAFSVAIKDLNRLYNKVFNADTEYWEESGDFKIDKNCNLSYSIAKDSLTNNNTHRTSARDLRLKGSNVTFGWDKVTYLDKNLGFSMYIDFGKKIATGTYYSSNRGTRHEDETGIYIKTDSSDGNGNLFSKNDIRKAFSDFKTVSKYCEFTFKQWGIVDKSE